MKMKRRRKLVSARLQAPFDVRLNSPFYQILPPPFPHKLLTHLAAMVEQISHQAEPQIPLQCLGQGVLAEADVPPLGLLRV
jgi:hypothetical protein